jgi:hypothetical protein
VIEDLICCHKYQDRGDVEARFFTVVLNFYDGPTSGVMRCRSCSAAYRFTMIDWDDNQDVRIHAFAPLPSNSFQQVVDLLSKYEAPKWPMWFTLRQYTSNRLYDLVEKQLDEILETAGAATMVLALSQWGERILAARRLAESDLKNIQDLSSLEDPKAAYDWFSFIGMVRRVS